eukprot:TRINITY_DN6716_c0_g1_i1.p1 TRINITY_DN6716_c0_g1~~TRINITY_DN6716_c0_g1_i1.p1  ORF type:complete len:365 (-),score=24.09 TRINITY_DN6716_c0_g1_i1:259-1209(-)
MAPPPQPQPVAVVGAPINLPPLQGWLKKRGDQGFILDLTWKLRYFRQTEPLKLTYSEDAAGTRPKGWINLAEVVQVSRISDIVYGFTVRVPGRDYVLQAVSEAERAEWMVGLQNRCPKLAGGPPVMGAAGGTPAAVGFVPPQGPAQPQPQYGGYSAPSAPVYQPQQGAHPQQQTIQTVQVAPNGTNAMVPGVSNAAYNSMQVQLPAEISRSVNDSMHLVNRHMSTFQVVTGAPWQFICDYGGIFNMLDMNQRQSWGGNFGNMINDTYLSTLSDTISKKCYQNPANSQALIARVPSRTVRFRLIDDTQWNVLAPYGG